MPSTAQSHRPAAETLPRAARETLSAQEIGDAEILLRLGTDLSLDGRYQPSWLVVTAERLLVVSAAGSVMLAVATAEVEEICTEPMVGAGVLRARLEGVYIDLVRYSNRQARVFEQVADRLDDFVRGEPLVITEADLRDSRRCDSCGLMLEMGETCPRCVSRGAVLARMWGLARPYRRTAAGMMTLLVVGIGLDLVSPQLTRFLVDDVLAVGTVGPGPGRQLQLLAMVVGVLAVVQVARQVVNVINGRLASRVGTGLTFDIRGRLVDHFEKLSVSFYDRQQSGSLIGRVAYDTEALHGFVQQLTQGFLLQLLMVLGVWIMMFTIDAQLALLALLPAPLVMGATVFFWRKVFPRYYRTWDASSRQASALGGMLGGIRAVKAFGQERAELQRFQRASGRLRSARRHVDTGIVTFNGVVGVLFQMGGWMVWYFGGRGVIGGDLTLGELMAFFGYLWMFYGPLAALPQLTNWLTQFVTQANRIFEVLDAPVAVAEPEHPIPVAPVAGRIRLERVEFGYESHAPVLRDVSFEIQPGEMIGVVGPSGSGKTTLVNLITRFYDPDRGRVSIDGVDLRDIANAELRSQIGVVLQEPALFPGSISDNIAYGRPQASPEEILGAARAGNCHDFILRHTHAYDSWLGERGAGLSGGERQRIGIARAVLVDPRVLILDEATSNVDADSEAAIQGALARLVRGRTTIAIAHRLSTLRNADRILVFEGGRLAEEGNHQQLIDRGGTYRRLLGLQGLLDQDGLRLTEADPPAHEPEPPWLEPGRAHLARGRYGTLELTVDGTTHRGIEVLRCFPVHHQEAYLSLRLSGDGGRELGLVRQVQDWDGRTRGLLREALARRYFVHTIVRIDSMELVANHLEVEALTDLGPVGFTMRWHADSAQSLGERGILLTDVDQNHYAIPDRTAGSPHERKLMNRYMYWHS